MGEARHFLGVYYSNTAAEGTCGSRDTKSEYWEGGSWGSRDDGFVFAMVGDVNRTRRRRFPSGPSPSQYSDLTSRLARVPSTAVFK